MERLRSNGAVDIQRQISAASISDEDASGLNADIMNELAKNAELPLDMQLLEELRRARGHPFSVLTQESIARAEEDGENESEPEPTNSDDEADRQTPPDLSKISDVQEKLLAASEHDYVEVVKEIVKAQPNLAKCAHDEDGYTPLHRAAYSNHIKIIRLLLLSGADANARTDDNWTPLHSAARWGNARAASLLIHNGADVNAVTEGGQTALHLAAEHSKSLRYKKIIMLLLLNPCIDVNIINNLGFTARQLAQKTFAGPLFDLAENGCATLC